MGICLPIQSSRCAPKLVRVALCNRNPPQGNDGAESASFNLSQAVELGTGDSSYRLLIAGEYRGEMPWT